MSELHKIQCRLCNCEGVEGTVLCKEHLQGYQYAMEILRSSSQTAARNYLLKRIQQQKGADNEK